MSAALGSASLGAGFAVHAGIDDSARGDGGAGIDHRAATGDGARIDDCAGIDDYAGFGDGARERRGSALGNEASGFWDRTEESEYPDEDLGYAEDLSRQVEETGGAYWHWPLT
jgi:hypothetical protein